MNKRIITTEFIEEDIKTENRLRPDSLKGYIGQPKIKDCLLYTSIENVDEAVRFSRINAEKLCIISQTTFNYNKFKELVEIIEKMGYHISVLNTICSTTKERQDEALCIAGKVDAMLVVGDKHSSNTQKLFEISKKACNNTYYIQTLDDLDLNQLGSSETVGITAGASTPNKIIEEVQNNVRFNF